MIFETNGRYWRLCPGCGSPTLQCQEQPIKTCIWCKYNEVPDNGEAEEPNEPDEPTQHNGYYQT